MGSKGGWKLESKALACMQQLFFYTFTKVSSWSFCEDMWRLPEIYTLQSSRGGSLLHEQYHPHVRRVEVPLASCEAGNSCH